MTTLKRTFDLEKRTLKSTDRCYVGQVYDHISTTLEFTYNPINALTDGGYTAYIVFDLCSDDGDLFVFGPGSSPRFDGRTFEIPTSVTSRITTQRLDYQLWLIKNRTEWNGRIDELGDTEYLFSAKDTLAFKPTTKCRCPSKDPCRPPQPNLEPGTLGWVNYLRDHAVLTPFTETYGTLEDGTEGVTIHIPTYNEDRDQDLVLHIPYLDSEGLIDIHTFLRVVEEYNPDVTHDQIMTALCVQNLLDEKLDKSSVIDEWSDEYEELDVPSARLTKATLDTKLDQNAVIDSYDTPWSEYKDKKVPFSADLLRRNPVGPWDPKIEYREDSIVLHEGMLFISQGNPNIGHTPQVWPPGTETPEKKAWWLPVRGSGSGDTNVSTFVEIIGPNEYSGVDDNTGLYAYDVYHHFNTSDLFIQARMNKGDALYTVDAVYDVTDKTKVRVLLSNQITDNELVVYISPGGGIEGESAKLNYQALAYKDQPDGYAGLDSNGKLTKDKIYSTDDVDKGEPSDLVQSTAVKAVREDLRKRLNTKTDITMAIPEWSKDVTYNSGSTVVYDKMLFISQVDDNLGSVPISGSDLSEDWGIIQGGGGSTGGTGHKTFRGLFGGDGNTSHTLVHGLNTYNIIFQIRSTVLPIRYVQADVYSLDKNTIQINTALPLDDEMCINILACDRNAGIVVTGISTKPIETETMLWTYINDSGKPTYVQLFDENGNEIRGDVTQESADSFSPVIASLTSPSKGTMLVKPADLEISFNQVTSVGIDVVQFGYERGDKFLVQVYLDGTGRMMPDIIQDPGTGVISIDFGDTPLTGSVVLVSATQVYEFTDETDIRYEHGLGRVVGAQVYLEGTGQAMADIVCVDENTVEVSSNIPLTGYLIIL